MQLRVVFRTTDKGLVSVFSLVDVSRRKCHVIAASHDFQANLFVLASLGHGEDLRFRNFWIGLDDDFSRHRELVDIASLSLFPWVRDDSGNNQQVVTGQPAFRGYFGGGFLCFQRR
mgnify:CR=1 FL=1